MNKTEEKNNADVVILGTGTAALITALRIAQEFRDQGIKDKKICVVGRGPGNSGMSAWTMLNKKSDQEISELKNKLMANAGEGASRSQKNLLNYLAENHAREIDRFLSDVVKNTGLTTSAYPRIGGVRFDQKTPGKTLLTEIQKQAEQLGVKITTGEISGIRIDKSSEGADDIVVAYGKDKQNIHAKKLIVATGGIGRLRGDTTGSRSEMPDVLEILGKLGIELENMNKANNNIILLPKGNPARGIITAPFLKRSDFSVRHADGTETKFSDMDMKTITDGDYQPGAVMAAMKAATKDGGTVVIHNNMTQEEYDEYKKHDVYFVFDKVDSVKDVRNLTIQGGYHYSLGGVKIAEDCRSVSNRNIFAIGEAASLFGNSRLPGMGHTDSITISPLIAKAIARDMAVGKSLMQRNAL